MKKMKKSKKINLESKALIQKLKAIDERIDLLLSEQQEPGQVRIKSINKLNEITRKINAIESNIHFTPLHVKIEDIKNLNHLYDEQKKYDHKLNSIDKKLFDLSVQVNKRTKARMDLLVTPELQLDIDNRIRRMYKRDENIDEDLRKDPILFQIVSDINSDIEVMNRHNIVLNRKQVATCIKNKFIKYKQLMKGTPYPINITISKYFDAVAPKVEIVKKNDWQSKQLYTDAIK